MILLYACRAQLRRGIWRAENYTSLKKNSMNWFLERRYTSRQSTAVFHIPATIPLLPGTEVSRVGTDHGTFLILAVTDSCVYGVVSMCLLYI